MRDSKNIELIYEYLIDNDSIPTKKLNEIGYNAKDINDLISSRTINRVARGYYQLVDVDKLYYYGRRLVSKKEFAKADRCFNKCYEVNPKNPDACFQLFLRAVVSMKYNEAIKYLDGFYGKSNFDIKDVNYYLFLLSNVTTLPEKYKDYIINLKYEDIKVRSDDKRFTDIIMQNSIRLDAYNHHFSCAYSRLNRAKAINGKMEVSNVIAKYLLVQAIQIETKSKDALLGYAFNKDYKGIINFLGSKTQLHPLSAVDRCTLKLAKKIAKIMEEQTIPNIMTGSSNTIFGAIDADDYQLALECCKSYNYENNIDNSRNIIHCLLSDIVELTNDIKKRKQETLKKEEENQLVIDNLKETETSTVDDNSLASDVTDKDINNGSNNVEKKIASKNINAENIKKYISQTVSKLVEHEDLIILNPMSTEERKMVYDIIADMPGVMGFSIENEPKRIVLRYMNQQPEFIKLRQIFDDYRTDIINGNYEEGIKKMKYITSNIKYPKSFIFYNLGICYSKMHDKKNAIKYLTVYQGLENKCCEHRKDVSDLIASLKGNLDINNYKPFFKMDVNEFESKDNIYNIDEIKNVVLYSKITIEEACIVLEVSKKNIPLIRLIIAKELYLLGKEYIADKLVKAVGKEKNKSDAVKDLLSELIINRKLYMTKKSEEENAPTLSLAKLI
jgi:tetratricopeptide (TPR) repeat protein